VCIVALVGEVVAAEHLLVLFGALLVVVLDVDIIARVITLAFITLAFVILTVGIKGIPKLGRDYGNCNANREDDESEGLDGDHFD